MKVKTELTKIQQTQSVSREQIINFLMPALKGKQISDTDKELAIQQALAMNLNPAKREVFFIPFNNQITLITSYEVYCKRAQPFLDGMEIMFEGDKKNLQGQIIDVNENPKFISLKIWKKGSKKPFEFTFTKKQLSLGKENVTGSFWQKDPRTMMMKTSIVRAFRIVFPEINLPYSSEELIGKDISNIKEEDVQNVEIVEEEKKENHNPILEKFFETLKTYCEALNREEDFVLKNIIAKINEQKKNKIETIEEATVEDVELMIGEMEQVIIKKIKETKKEVK